MTEKQINNLKEKLEISQKLNEDKDEIIKKLERLLASNIEELSVCSNKVVNLLYGAEQSIKSGDSAGRTAKNIVDFIFNKMDAVDQTACVRSIFTNFFVEVEKRKMDAKNTYNIYRSQLDEVSEVKDVISGDAGLITRK